MNGRKCHSLCTISAAGDYSLAGVRDRVVSIFCWSSHPDLPNSQM